MVLAYHGQDVSQQQLAVDLKTSSVTGTEYEDLAREASRYIFGKEVQSDADAGYRAVIWPANQGSEEARNVFEHHALQDLKNGDPVFVSINNEQVYGPGYGTVHQVVLYGADLNELGKPVTFYYLDPSYLQESPEKSIDAEHLWKAMVNNPEPGYVW